MHRFLGYLSLVLMALLPIAASHAAIGCGHMAASMPMADDASTDDCGGCSDMEQGSCRSACIALCQILPPVNAAALVSFDPLPAPTPPALTAFTVSQTSGPEPPPPELSVDPDSIVSTEIST